MADLKHAKEKMRKWLCDNKNAIFGIEDAYLQVLIVL